MKENLFRQSVRKAFDEKRRLVVPLVGFPGLNITGGTIKLAQQNYSEHFKVLDAIAEEFKPDVIFPLMDLSVEANALGRYTVFPKEESATVVRDEFHLNELKYAEKIDISCDMRLFGYVETLRMVNEKTSSSILRGAYVTGPYTLAALLMGADDAAAATIMRPDELNEVCEFTTKKIQRYVELLISAGAQIICILEPSAVMLGPKQFEKFSSQFVKEICDSCNDSGVASIYHICGNSMHLIEKMVEAGVYGLSLDSPEAGIDIVAAAKRIPEDVAVIGNVSPIGALLNGKPVDVERDVLHLLNVMEPYPNFVLSTGCDLPQEVSLDNIRAFMQTGRKYKITKNIIVANN